jgi:hypothetical protein
MQARAWLNLRFTVPERRAAFASGVERLGFEVKHELTRDPRAGDVMVTWNRIHEGDEAARIFTDRGLPVVVSENSSWGNSFAGREWYTVCKDYHNVAGCFPVGGPERWDSLGVELEPWRTEGETVVLASRGIGPACYRMPRDWPQRQQGRLRAHPGRGEGKPLREDLANCGRVVTWGSGAAVRALIWGIPVESHQPNWIAAQDNTDAGRLAMLRRLAWAQWTMEEIASGEPIARLLNFTAR